MPKYASNATLAEVQRFPADLQPDQSTYRGRALHFLSMTDPRTLLTTPTQLAHCEALLRRVDRHEAGWDTVKVADYLDARQRRQSIVHPETQKPIVVPFRFAAFVPMNFINLCGMLAPSQQTPLRSMFWQFSNQTYNVGFNYCNGSGTEGLSLRELTVGYLVATSTACGLSYWLSKAFSHSSSSSSTTPSARRQLMRLFIPYTAVACANIANLSVIRFRDVWRGIAVQDRETGEDLLNGAPSAVAGRLAVAQVALSRIMIPVPLMLLPPVFLNALFHPVTGVRFFVQRRATLYLPMNVSTLVSVLCVALPLSVAVFPESTVVPVRWLEAGFQDLRNTRGHPVDYVQFHKGI